MAQLETAFEAFKANPTAETAWELQQAMVVHALGTSAPEAIPQSKAKKPINLKTKKGEIWDERLAQIVDLFDSFDWKVIPFHPSIKTGLTEQWKLIDKDGNRALLCLNDKEFWLRMDHKNSGELGPFFKYLEKDSFHELLMINGIKAYE